MQVTIQRNKFFSVSCSALLGTCLSSGIRGGLLNQSGTEFNLPATEPGTIAATPFWGFPFALIPVGIAADIIKIKNLLVPALILILVTIFAGSSVDLLELLFISILFVPFRLPRSPVITILYPENKTTKASLFICGFPGKL